MSDNLKSILNELQAPPMSDNLRASIINEARNIKQQPVRQQRKYVWLAAASVMLFALVFVLIPGGYDDEYDIAEIDLIYEMPSEEELDMEEWQQYMLSYVDVSE